MRYNDRYQLGYVRKQKVGMEFLGILCLAVSKTEAVFEVIDGVLDGCANLVGKLPYVRWIVLGLRWRFFLG